VFFLTSGTVRSIVGVAAALPAPLSVADVTTATAKTLISSQSSLFTFHIVLLLELRVIPESCHG
jgi:hypothetical protein